MPLYATETILAQKPTLIGLFGLVIVQIQSQEMNALPKTTISVKRAKHVFSRVRIPLILCFPMHFSSACKTNNWGIGITVEL